MTNALHVIPPDRAVIRARSQAGKTSVSSAGDAERSGLGLARAAHCHSPDPNHPDPPKDTFMTLPRSLLRACVPGLLAVVVFSAEVPKVDIHGFVSQGFLKTNHNNYLGETEDGSFAFNEVALNFQSRLTDDLRVGVQFFARDLGGIGNNRVGIDWAYFDYHWRDELGFRVGQVKVARGLYNEFFDLDLANPTVLLPQAVYDQRLRDFLVSVEGASAYGTLPLGVLGALEYEGFLGTKTLERDGSVAEFMRNAVYSASTDFRADSVTLGRMCGAGIIWQTPLSGLRLDASYLQFTDLVAHGDLLGAAPVPVPVDLAVNHGRNAVFGGEYARGDLRVAGEFTMWDLEYDIAGGQGTTRWGGWYGQVAYKVLSRLEVAVTYGEFYDDRSDRRGENRSDPKTGYQHDASLSLRYDPLDNWTIKAEGHYITGYTQMFSQDNPDGLQDDTMMLALKTTVSF
jgi:hypothetical protein